MKFFLTLIFASYTCCEIASNETTRCTLPRSEVDAPEIVYYFTKPQSKERYPIGILCGGSTTKDTIGSIVHLHSYLLQYFLNLGSAVISLEQWGVDGNLVDKQEFMSHYTRSQRLKDHKSVIEYLKSNPPEDWDGTLILLGASEGGPLVTTLTEIYPDILRATVNGVGPVICHGMKWCGLLYVHSTKMGHGGLNGIILYHHGCQIF